MSAQTIPWIILFVPLLAAAIIFFLGRFSRALSSGTAIGAAALCGILSWWLFAQPDPSEPVRLYWLNFDSLFQVPFGLTVDSLSKVMLVVVNTIAPLVFIYSIGYMAKEEGYSRYFAGLSLFLFSMLGIVLADNFLMMFIFWELVGVSSYILIGHYYSRDSAAEAAKQAFLVNRIGDFGFMLGILMLWLATGSVVFSQIEDKPSVLEAAGPYFTAACVLVFCGTIGKSAQMPLHVWLPNSMEGPTPVSSLLHAATMVAAGVYMLARIFPIIHLSETALTVIAAVGAITCFVAGLMGTQQNDIKRILAYSTISQLGYMVLGIAVAPSWDVAMFHLFNHAFFKCLLFLCAGSVIVAMHHEQDIWKMGALKNKMPVTFLAMVAGGFALMGIPPFSGFFSKDLIILWACEKGALWYWLAAGGVVVTAFYTTRLLMVVFLGKPRSDHAKRAGESPLVMVVPLVILGLASFISGWPIIQKRFFTIEHPHHLPVYAEFVTYIFLVAGVLIAFLIYRRGPEKDPILIPAFANRLYIDNAYAWLVRKGQDGLATASAWADRWLVDLFVVQIPGKLIWACGFVLRFLQFGNIQAYAFFFGAGVLGLIYLLIAR